MADETPENPPQTPPAAPTEQPDTVIEQGVKALKDLKDSILGKSVEDITKKTEAVNKWYSDSREALSHKTASALNAIKKEVAEIQKMDKKEFAKDVIENMNTTLNNIINSTRSEISSVFNSVKEEGSNFLRSVKENGLLAALQTQGADLLAGGMRLFDALRNSAAFTFGPMLKMMGLDEMVGGDRILLANALKKIKVKGMRIDDNAPEATMEYISEQYDAHFATGVLRITKPVFFQRLVTRLQAEVLNGKPVATVTYKQLNDAADLLVKTQQEDLKKQPAPSPTTPPAGPTPPPGTPVPIT